jgi:hypothetical protein
MHNALGASSRRPVAFGRHPGERAHSPHLLRYRPAPADHRHTHEETVSTPERQIGVVS